MDFNNGCRDSLFLYHAFNLYCSVRAGEPAAVRIEEQQQQQQQQ